MYKVYFIILFIYILHPRRTLEVVSAWNIPGLGVYVCTEMCTKGTHIGNDKLSQYHMDLQRKSNFIRKN